MKKKRCIKGLDKAYYQDATDLLANKQEFDCKKKHYRILAYAGDHSSSGMGNKARIYRIPADKVSKVDDYLHINELFTEYSMMALTCDNRYQKSEYGSKLFDIWCKAQDSMQDIFRDKWDYRSSWCWNNCLVPIMETKIQTCRS